MVNDFGDPQIGRHFGNQTNFRVHRRLDFWTNFLVLGLARRNCFVQITDVLQLDKGTVSELETS